MARTVRVLAWNLGGLSDQDAPALIPEEARWINSKSVDLLLVNEAFQSPGAADNHNQVEELAALCNFPHVEYVVATDLGLGAVNGKKLIGVLSKFPLSSPHELPAFCDELWGGCYRTLEVRADIDGRTHRVYALRWSPHVREHNVAMAHQLRDRILSLDATEGRLPTIAGGDFNQSPMALLDTNGDMDQPQDYPEPFKDLLRQTGLKGVCEGALALPPPNNIVPNDYVLYRGPYSVGESGNQEGGGNKPSDHPLVLGELVPLVDNATFVSQSVPNTAFRNVPIAIEIRLSNSGTSTWDPQEGYALDVHGGGAWSVTRADLPGVVPPGSDAVIRFRLSSTAPGQQTLVMSLLGPSGRFANESPSTAISITGEQTMTVSVTPFPVRGGVAVQFNVTAVAASGSTVAGQVVVSGQVIGATNTSLSFTFRVRRRRVNGEWEAVYPVGVVKANGFTDQEIDFGFQDL